MTWVRFVVEVRTNDEREGTEDRLRAQVLRTLEHRFGAVTVEWFGAPPPAEQRERKATR